MLKNYPEPAVEKRINFAIQHDIDIACWAELVTWAYGFTDFEDCFWQRCKDTEYPYCGKCQSINHKGGHHAFMQL